MTHKVTLEVPDRVYEDIRRICFYCDGLRPLPLEVTVMTALMVGIGTMKSGILGGVKHATLDTGGFLVQIETTRFDKTNMFG